MTRITHRSIQESTLSNLQRNLTAMNVLQEQLSTQKRINRPSDDPTGTVSALTLRADLRATEQHRRNADDGIGWLTAAESALTTTADRLRRVQSLTLQALNGGAQSAAGLEAIAVEVRGIRDDVLAQANTQYLGRSVFAGTAGGPAYTSTPPGTYTYHGVPSAPVTRQVTSDAAVRVDTVGTDVFGGLVPTSVPGDDTTSVFALLDKIQTLVVDSGGAATPALREAATAALGVALEALGKRYETVTSALSGIGARYSRVADAQQSAEDRKLSLTTSLSEVESIDLPATIVQLQSQEIAYKAALGATAKVLQPSLMDFLR